ncbi:MAG: hypothetical protein D6732_18440 [Methanobacteriota archaeon]|nr:MAG: hypothetical protein D6732_18440 [Euryarchaeota archaeon]
MGLSTKDYIAIALTALTGIIHLFIGLVTTISEFNVLNLLLLLNGIGYLSLLTGIYFPNLTGGLTEGKDVLLKETLIGFTIITIIAYFVTWGTEGLQNIVGMATKIIELALVLVLLTSLGSSPSE